MTGAVNRHFFNPDALGELQESAKRYNSANTRVRQGGVTYVAVALFTALSFSTPLAILGGALASIYTSDPSMRMIGGGIMLSAVTRVFLGSTGAYIMTAGALFGLMRGTIKPSTESLAGIAAMVAVGAPIGLSAATLAGAAGFFIHALYKRAEQTPLLHTWSYLKNTFAPEALGSLALGGEEKTPSWKSAWLDHTYTDLTHRLGDAAVLGEAFLSKNDIVKIADDANAARSLVKGHSDKAMYGMGALAVSSAALVGLSIFPFIPLFVGALIALSHGREDVAKGFGVATVLTLVCSGSPVSLIAAGALALAGSAKYSEYMPVALSAVGSLLILNMVTTVLFTVIAASIPYAAWHLAQREEASKPLHAALELQKMGLPLQGNWDTRFEFGTGIPPMVGTLDRATEGDAISIPAWERIPHFELASVAVQPGTALQPERDHDGVIVQAIDNRVGDFMVFPTETVAEATDDDGDGRPAWEREHTFLPGRIGSVNRGWSTVLGQWMHHRSPYSAQIQTL